MKIVTVKELSETLKIKPKTVYQLAQMRRIPSLKIAGSLRFDMEAIEAWLKDCQQKPVSGYNLFTKLEARKGDGKRK